MYTFRLHVIGVAFSFALVSSEGTLQDQSAVPSALRGSSQRRTKSSLKGVFSSSSSTKHENALIDHDELFALEHKAEEVMKPDSVSQKRMVVTYKNDKGKEEVKQYASKVYHDFTSDSVMTIDIDDTGIEVLTTFSDVVSVEEDVEYEEQGFLERVVDTEHARRLQELNEYNVKMVEADQIDVGPYATRVCVVDSGIAANHPDIDYGRVNGKDRVSYKDDSYMAWNGDVRGHGTHVAGIISAISGNGYGVRGLGKVPLYITRGLNDAGRAFESDIREAMEQCESAGARVISLSLSGNSITSAMTDLLDRLYAKGILIVAAAGNEGLFKNTYPAAHYSVVSVVAVKEDKWYWPWSNYAPTTELAAPGYDVLSTAVDPNGNGIYAYYTGTSMAAPHVAGAAAILWSHFPYCTNNQIRYALAYTADDQGEPGCDNDYGYGIIQTKKAYNFLSENSCIFADWGKRTPEGTCDIIDALPN